VQGPGRWPKGVSFLASVTAAATLAAAAVASSDSISTVAGNGSAGFSGDGGQATAAKLDSPSGVNGMAGGYLIADTDNQRIRRVDSSGVVQSVAGTGVASYNGDNLAATTAKLNKPSGVAPTADGGYLIADTDNERVRKVSAGGTITTVAGNGGSSDDPGGGDGGPANLTHLYHPSAVAPTADGGYLIADQCHHTIRKVSAGGVITTVAGMADVGGYNGDNRDAATARLYNPRDVAPTADGGFLIADTDNNRIRKVSSDGQITTVAGTGTAGYNTTTSAVTARLDHPEGVAVLPDGGFLIADTGNDRVRTVSATGEISTVAGSGSAGYNGDDIPADTAKLSSPEDMSVVSGGLAIADSGNHRVRFVPAFWATPAAPAAPVFQAGAAPKADDLPPPAPPQAGKSVNAEPAKGVVLVRLPGRKGFIHLEDAASIPVGAIFDTTHGQVKLTTARDLHGTTQSGSFWAGKFLVAQKRTRRPVTDLLLSGGGLSKCRRARHARHASLAVAARKRPGRKVWGHVKGRFRTTGRHGAATVRGTTWLTKDTCNGTLVYVKHGLVAVRDFTRKRTFMVPTGKQHLSPSRRK
jgi:hypothetical protein